MADEYRRLPEFLSYYANNVRFETSPWEITMTFGEVGSQAEDGVVISQKVQIKMSWPQAKSMAIFLGINVVDHENKAGPDRLPEFVFGERLKHLGDRDLTLKEMFAEIIRVLDTPRSE